MKPKLKIFCFINRTINWKWLDNRSKPTDYDGECQNHLTFIFFEWIKLILEKKTTEESYKEKTTVIKNKWKITCHKK